MQGQQGVGPAVPDQQYFQDDVSDETSLLVNGRPKMGPPGYLGGQLCNGCRRLGKPLILILILTLVTIKSNLSY